MENGTIYAATSGQRLIDKELIKIVNETLREAGVPLGKGVAHMADHAQSKVVAMMIRDNVDDAARHINHPGGMPREDGVPIITDPHAGQ
ncbi:hypothetical protein [Streptomyces sp. S.PB5]|uniref:hypothetical protein n=1 Tax=Streptomyces sp. S.PB5 TaxID=3020844 RepID=UPI0025AF2DEC|nr:hypothetical protein [Streptomyces sp. S.PB5]MDN3029627.1 hypothetical protein [Streptomyces sp. S.PB5]